VARISWPWVTVVVTQEAGSLSEDLPVDTIVMSKPLEDDGVLASALLAEQRDVLRRTLSS
jgi:hypothetical protein